MPTALLLLGFSTAPRWFRPFRGGSPRLYRNAPRRTRALTVEVEPTALHRGQAVRVAVAHRRGGLLEGVRVGLLCTAWHDRPMYDNMTAAPPARAYETWVALELHGSATLELPPEAPYSYEGRHLSTAWMVVAQLPSGRIAELPIWVEP